jgi:hypothetical protein
MPIFIKEKIMEQFDYTKLANNLLDFMIEAYGLPETCEVLIGWDYTDDELYYLGFEKKTIEIAKRERKV